MFAQPVKQNKSYASAIGAVLALALACLGLGSLIPGVHLPSFEPKPPVTAATATKLEMDMANALSDKTLEDHEELYKVFAGIASYSEHATKLNSTLDVYKGIEEVILVYGINHKFAKISPVVDEYLSDLRQPAKFVDKKDEVIAKFTELANAVKYSAEHLKSTK